MHEPQVNRREPCRVEVDMGRAIAVVVVVAVALTARYGRRRRYVTLNIPLRPSPGCIFPCALPGSI